MINLIEDLIYSTKGKGMYEITENISKDIIVIRIILNLDIF